MKTDSKNNMEVMKFRKWVKYYILNESIKDIELNRILDKISKKDKLSDKEKTFLDLYNSTTDEEMKDFSHLSKNIAYEKIKNLLDKGKIVICDFYDKNGKINDKIISVENDFENETCKLKLKHGESSLHDKFLYNIIYNLDKDEYSLQTQDEFFEKIPVKND